MDLNHNLSVGSLVFFPSSSLHFQFFPLLLIPLSHGIAYRVYLWELLTHETCKTSNSMFSSQWQHAVQLLSEFTSPMTLVKLSAPAFPDSHLKYLFQTFFCKLSSSVRSSFLSHSVCALRSNSNRLENAMDGCGKSSTSYVMWPSSILEGEKLN